jgi:hypothetical protein
MVWSELASTAHIRRELRLSSVLAPWLLFALFAAATAGLAAVAQTRSLFLMIVCGVAAAIALAALAAWVWAIDREATRAARLPTWVAWRDSDWVEFERAFWSYVEGPQDTPDRVR